MIHDSYHPWGTVGANRSRTPSLSLSLSALSAGNACPRAPHRQAQAGVPTAQVENTNPKRTISTGSHPCRPDLEDGATSCSKTSGPSNRERIGQRVDTDSDPDTDKNESRREIGRVKPFLPRLGQYRSDHASPDLSRRSSRSRGRAHVLTYNISLIFYQSGPSSFRHHPRSSRPSRFQKRVDPTLHRYRYRVPALPS